MIFVSVLLRRGRLARAADRSRPVRGLGVVGGEAVAAPSGDRFGVAGRDGCYRKRMLEPHRAFIAERIDQNPQLTLHGLKDELAAQRVWSRNTVWEFLRRERRRLTGAV